MNNSVELLVKRLTDTAHIPVYATAGAACFDIHADVLPYHPSGTVGAGGTLTLHTGLAVEIPEGWVLLIYSRSGMGFNKNIRLANCVGIIDSDYTGEIMVKLTRDDNGWIGVSHGDRIAQGMLMPVTPATFREVSYIHETKRGSNGFGSTGMGANVVTAEEEATVHPIMTSPHLK